MSVKLYMDYRGKYLKYKTKYLILKTQNQTGGKKKENKCSIDDTDRMFFGSGGSSAIVVITKDKQVYKFFTLYENVNDINLDRNINEQNENVMNEINISKILTKNIVDKGLSKHIVKYIDSHVCNNVEELFKICPKSYVEFMKLSEEQKSRICQKYFDGYPTIKLNNTYNVIEMEYCDYPCYDFMHDISKRSKMEIEKYLDIFFFQMIHTIMSIQKKYPYFIHNDFFVRNIIGFREKDNGNYYAYEFNNKKYKVPQKIFFPKINDFGLTNLNDDYKNTKLHKSKYKDIYNSIFDVYDGGNMGSTSLMELCKNEPDKVQFLKLYFSNYFNVDIINEYKIKSKYQMDWNWSNILGDDFLKTVEMKDPIDLLNVYFYNIFGKINEEVS